MKNDDSQNLENTQEERPEIPRAGVVYGDTIYWCTIVATILVLAGSFVTFTTTNNYMDPSILLASIWEGKSVEEIWQSAAGGLPSGHWYMNVLTTGNGLTAAGIALGVFGVTPAIIASSVVLLREGKKFYGSLAVIAAIITVFAMLP